MKVYQLLQQGTGKQVFLVVEEDWNIVELKGLPEFLELRDSSGERAFLIRKFDAQELATEVGQLARAAGRGGDA